MQIHGAQLQAFQRVQDGNLDIGVHPDRGPYQRGGEGNIFRHVRVITVQGGGDVLGFGINHGAVPVHLEFVHFKGRGTIHGNLLAIERKLVPQGGTRALHIQAGGSVRSDETVLGKSDDLGVGNLRIRVVIQRSHLGQGLLLHPVIVVANLVHGDHHPALAEAALQDDGSLTGTVDDAAGGIVGHGDGDGSHALSGHGRHLDPRLVDVDGPTAVGIDRECLRRGAGRGEDHIGLVGAYGLGFSDLFFLIAGSQHSASCHCGKRV